MNHPQVGRRTAVVALPDAPPSPALLGVLQRDSFLAELFANLVGTRKVATLARGLTLRDEPLDLLGQARLLRADDVEVRVEIVDQTQQGLAPLFADHACIHCGIRLADELEHQTDTLWKVEVVVERLAIAGPDLIDPAQEVRVVRASGGC